MKIKVLFLALFLTACASGPGIVGLTENQVVSQLGYPMQKNMLSENSHVLLYRSEPGFIRYVTIRNGVVVNHYVRYQGGFF